jgi:hypothetical protein
MTLAGLVGITVVYFAIMAVAGAGPVAMLWMVAIGLYVIGIHVDDACDSRARKRDADPSHDER